MLKSERKAKKFLVIIQINSYKTRTGYFFAFQQNYMTRKGRHIKGKKKWLKNFLMKTTAMESHKNELAWKGTMEKPRTIFAV